jgi:hypothetical protein
VAKNSSGIEAQRLISTADLLREFDNATKSLAGGEGLKSLHGELSNPMLSGLAREILELSSPAHDAAAQCAKRDAWDQYVICKSLLEGRKIEAHSFGIKGYDVWGNHMAKAPYNFPVHLYDCFNTNQPSTFRNTFHAKCIASKTSTDQKGHHFETLSQHLAHVGPVSAVVKLDVEGAEFDVLRDLQKEDASKVAMMSVEYHSGLGGCGEVLESRHTEELAPALRNMDKFFSVVEGYGVFWGNPCKIRGYEMPCFGSHVCQQAIAERFLRTL